MALIACVECGRQISDQAAACPNCGHPVTPSAQATAAPPSEQKPAGKRRTGCVLIILIGVILAIVAACLLMSVRSSAPTATAASGYPTETREERLARLLEEVNDERRDDDIRLLAAKDLMAFHGDTAEGKAAAALAETFEERIRKANRGKQWSYWTNRDPMTGKTALGAEVRSNNTHSFDFPYAGAQHATLTLRRHPQHGSNVFLQIERGQLQCSYSGCDVLVRFGDAQPRTYRATGPSDNSSETLFIQGFADFQKRMEAADTVRIQANVYRQGAPTWEFDVSGFDPARIKHQ